MKLRKKIFLISISSCLLFIILPAFQLQAQSGSCKCSGAISAGLALPNSTFDSYCPQVKQYCSSCGNGSATCSGSFPVATQQECTDLNDPNKHADLAAKYGIPSAALLLINVSGSCSFTPSASAAASQGSSAGSKNPLPTIVPACARGTETPSLNCMLVLFATVAQWILGIAGSLALFYFVYGGVKILISRGNANAVGAGKTILTQAVIGIIIIFGAYLAVNFLVQNVLKATDIPSAEEASQKAAEGPLTEPLSGQKTETPKCPTCTCATGTDRKKLAAGFNGEADCSKTCKAEGWESGGCGITAGPNECNCYCRSGVSNIDAGITKTQAECNNKCLIQKREGGFCGSY